MRSQVSVPPSISPHGLFYILAAQAPRLVYLSLPVQNSQMLS